MTGEEAQASLDAAVAEFEKAFKTVVQAPTQAYFYHMVDGVKHKHVEVSGNGVVGEGELYPVYDTAPEAILAWRLAVKRFEGASFLYWRVRPEIRENTSEIEKPNPRLGKWAVYSRFCALP